MFSEYASPFRAIEFFAGLGGFAAAWPTVPIACAVDINQLAAKQYSLNFGHPYRVCEIESLSVKEISGWNANLWWMSPPCQPYSRRGNRLDIADPRARSLLRLIELLEELLPDYLVLENVVGFADSVAYHQFSSVLARAGYHWQVIELCPTQFGWPNRRPRFYLVASRASQLSAWNSLPSYDLDLARLLGDFQGHPQYAAQFSVSQQDFASYLSAIDRVIGVDRPTACFASSYGKAIVSSGSYVQLPNGGYRHFAPREVATLLGFPGDFKLCESLTARQLWQLFGNSLSLIAIRYVLSHLPHGPSLKLPWFAMLGATGQSQ